MEDKQKEKEPVASYVVFVLYNSLTYVVGYIWAAWITWLRRWLAVRMFPGIAKLDSEDTWLRFGLSIPLYAVIMGVAYVWLKWLYGDHKQGWNLWKALIINGFLLTYNFSWATLASGPMMEWLTFVRYGIAETDPGIFPFLFVSQLILSVLIGLCGLFAIWWAYSPTTQKTTSKTPLLAALKPTQAEIEELGSLRSARSHAVKCVIDSGFNYVSGFVWGNWLGFVVLNWVATEWFKKSSTAAWSVSSQEMFAHFESCMYISLVLMLARYWCPHSSDKGMDAKNVARRRRARVVDMVRFGFGFAFCFMWAVWNVFIATTGLSRVMFNEATGTYTCNGTTSNVLDYVPADYAGETFAGGIVVSIGVLVVYGLVSMRKSEYYPPHILWDLKPPTHAYDLTHYVWSFPFALSVMNWLVYHLLPNMINWFPNKTSCMVVQNAGHRLVTMLVLFLMYAPVYLYVALPFVLGDSDRAGMSQEWWFETFKAFVSGFEKRLNNFIDGVGKGRVEAESAVEVEEQ